MKDTKNIIGSIVIAVVVTVIAQVIVHRYVLKPKEDCNCSE